MGLLNICIYIHISIWIYLYLRKEEENIIWKLDILNEKSKNRQSCWSYSTDQMNQWIIDKDNYGTPPATPGLSNIWVFKLDHFSKHLPSGLMLSISWNVRVSVRVSVCSLLSYRLNVFLLPLPEVGCPKILEIPNHLGKVMERSGLRFEHFCLEVV